MINLDEVFATLSARESGAQISRTGQIARLREFAERLRQGSPFRVGDLVTPRADSPLHGKGHPSVVVALAPSAQPDFRCDNPGSLSYGAVHDIRVAHMDGRDAPVMHWCESVYYESYTEAHEKLAGKTEGGA